MKRINTILPAIAILISFLLLMNASAFSQNHDRCAKDQAFERLKEKDPIMYKSVMDQMKKRAKERSSNAKIPQKGIQKAVTTKYIIPIVFHVLHTDGPEKISEAQVIDAVKMLNEDFNALSPDTTEIDSVFWPIYADVGVEFRLAQIDPDGNCSNGINYYFDPKNTNGETCEWNNVQANWAKANSSSNQWDYDKYLNIYTLTGGGSWSYGPIADNRLSGVGVNHGGVGSIGTAPPYGGGWARTLTHEIGHWFSLPHTWGLNDPNDPDACGADDGIDDTPNTDGTWGCDLDENSCDAGEPGDVKDNTQNYMDYGCSIMFTNGQKAEIIKTLLDSVMENLHTLTNLDNTGTADPYVYGSTPCQPRVEVKMDTEGDICPSSPVSYSYNMHRAIADSVVWKFPGGSPDTSTSDNPEITYAASGKYDVILTGYSNGLSGTDTLFDAVEIITLDGGVSFPFVETFEDPLEFDSLWLIINSNEDNFTWKNIATSSYSGDRCIRMKNNSDAPSGKFDEVVSPFIDLSSATDSVVLSFMMTTAQIGSANDRLDILFTKTCGDNWNKFYSKQGEELSTVTSSDVNYKPASSSDWRREYITLPIGYNVSDVQFKFKFISNSGSNLFIDDINYSIVGIDDKSIDRSLRIYPNPISSNSIISFDLLNQEEVAVEIHDVLGRKISSRNYGQLSKGNHQLEIGNTLENQKGIHIVKIKFNKEVVTRKVVVE